MLLLRSLSLSSNSLSCTFGRPTKSLGARELLCIRRRSFSSNSSSRVRVSGLLLFQQDAKSNRRSLHRCYSSAPLSYSYAPLDPSCFSPSLGSLVDISEYLMNGCSWKDAPKCPDYVGPVFIGQTPDGRGRGLYATRDVAAGDVLVISNAFAATYNDTDRIEMYLKIASILKQSPKALRQYYTLAADADHDNMEVPNVKLFDPSIPNADIDSHENLEFDEKRVIHILNVNSFAGQLKSSKTDPEMRLTGLWLLPSFINHSCSPNASRLVVGEAMFILASHDIRAQEEITISYTDVMVPLKRREDNLGETGYGFCCQCKRCLLERSVQQDLREISERYHVLYDKAAEEVYSAVTTAGTPSAGTFPVCVELFGLYNTLVKKVGSLKGLTKLEQQWILGGYSHAFLGNWIVSGYATGFSPASNYVNSTALDLIEAMKATESGILRTLSFTTILTMVAEKEKKKYSSLTPSLLNLALDECIRVYGKQRLDVAVQLIEQSAGIVPFF